MLDGLPRTHCSSGSSHLSPAPSKSVTSAAVHSISDHSGSSFLLLFLAATLHRTTFEMFKPAGIAYATAMLTQAMALPSSNPAPSGLQQNARV